MLTTKEQEEKNQLTLWLIARFFKCTSNIMFVKHIHYFYDSSCSQKCCYDSVPECSFLHII